MAAFSNIDADKNMQFCSKNHRCYNDFALNFISDASCLCGYKFSTPPSVPVSVSAI